MKRLADRRCRIVVGSGGVGKTTVAAALGVAAAEAGESALVMTFDPSLRLKTALGVGEEARDHDIEVPLTGAGVGRLAASLLDARKTFDRLVTQYAPDEEARQRVLGNHFYNQLSGALAGILEYMAVERLYEVVREGRYDRIILDTPPTRQALDFLEAPDRIVAFLDSGALRLALKPWFDAAGRLKPAAALGPLGSRLESYLDQVVGLDLLREMAEFFHAFAPLFAGFRSRAREVKELLASRETGFLLVTQPAPERLPDTLFFARKLHEAGYAVDGFVVNRVHPRWARGGPIEPGSGEALLAWLGERDQRGLTELRGLLGGETPLAELPLLPAEPTAIPALGRLGREVLGRFEED